MQFPVCLCCCFSVTNACLTLCNPMGCCTPGSPVLHYLLELAQIHVHWVGLTLCLTCLSTVSSSVPPSPPALNISQHQGLFQWFGSLHQVAKVLGFQLQHQFFQWIFRADFLLGLTDLISLLSKELSRDFFSTTVWKHQFFGIHPFLFYSLNVPR